MRKYREAHSGNVPALPHERIHYVLVSAKTPILDIKVKRDCDFALYRERNLVERFFNKIKHYRAIATRDDKLAQNFLAAVQLVATIILLN